MKCAKTLVPLILIITSLGMAGCKPGEKKQIKEVAERELDRHKAWSEEGGVPSSSMEEIFFEEAPDPEYVSEMSEVYARFFEDFSYSIKQVTMKEEGIAQVSIKAQTRDGTALAKEFDRAQLGEQMIRRANGGNLPLTDKDRSLLLEKVLEEDHNPAIETSFEMNLYKRDGEWRVQKSQALENALVGGFLTSANDPFLLTPEETLSVWFDTFKNLDLDDMRAFFGVSNLAESEQGYATALVEQVEKYFDYQILSSQETGPSKASVRVLITSFHGGAIESNYEAALRNYLSTPEAVIDGEEARYEKACQLLLECIEGNELTSQSEVSFEMSNNGTSWGLEQDVNESLGAAIFGTLPGSLGSMEAMAVDEY